MSNNGERLDVYLVSNNYFSSRTSAQRAIEKGNIKVNDIVIDAKNYLVKENDKIEVLPDEISFVSRGGFKLEKAINTFNIAVNDKVALDIGASTGGFSDCLLKHSAKLVYALDVGTNQLVEQLRNNPRIISIENTNFRYVDKSIFKEPFSLVVIDVSFISLYYIFATLATFDFKNLEIVALIKPQFETTKQNISKNGVVKEEKVHIEVLNKVIKDAKLFNFNLQGLTFSPLQGEKGGNIEFLGYFKKQDVTNLNIDIPLLVKQAHAYFKEK
jgi:23S rRNA (cytidine1920-2'-O)/16S rRNA (cytidine1409-2'-O)-methyltransferase